MTEKTGFYYYENTPSNRYRIQRYNCKKCNFETHFVLNWLQHTTKCLVNPAVMKATERNFLAWHSCAQCKFKTQFKSNLARHKILKHSGDDEVPWYRCTECPYKAKLKSLLKQHLYARHMDEDVVKKFQVKIM